MPPEAFFYFGEFKMKLIDRIKKLLTKNQTTKNSDIDWFVWAGVEPVTSESRWKILVASLIPKIPDIVVALVIAIVSGWVVKSF